MATTSTSFSLKVKQARWAADDPTVVAVVFNITEAGYPDNTSLYNLWNGGTFSLGDSHEFVDSSGSSIKVLAGTFRTGVSAGLWSLRYGSNIPQRDALIAWFTARALQGLAITLKVKQNSLTTAKYVEWLPPRKIFVPVWGNNEANYIKAIGKMSDLFENKFGYESIGGDTSVKLPIRDKIPNDLRRCDTVVMYVPIPGYSLAPSGAGTTNEADNIQETAFGDLDDDIRDTICSKKWNGASVTVIFDGLVTDLADAPVNLTLTASNAIVQNALRPVGSTGPSWPSNVRVLYGVNRNIDMNSSTDPMANLRYGSNYYQSTFFAEGFLQTLSGLTTLSGVTYRQLVQGVRDFYRNQKNMKPYMTSSGEQAVADGLYTIDPMLGCSAVADMDAKVFTCTPDYAPIKQPGPIKKAVIVGVDCWNNWTTVTDGVFLCPYITSPRNDSAFMYKQLTEKMSFLPENVAVLRDQPGRKQVLTAIDWLMSDNVSGNTLVFYFSGHGAQWIDAIGGDEVDGNDEFICLQDGVHMERFYDDEVYTMLLKRNTVPGVNLWCFFDSCHSGTMGDARYLTTAEFDASATPSGKICQFYTNQTNRPSSDDPANTYVICATSDTKTTYEFKPQDVNLPVPVAPVGVFNSTWEYSANPPFSCMVYFLWKIMEERNWQSITVNNLLIKLKEKYNTLTTTQAPAVPTLGCFTSNAGLTLQYPL